MEPESTVIDSIILCISSRELFAALKIVCSFINLTQAPGLTTLAALNLNLAAGVCLVSSHLHLVQLLEILQFDL